VLKRLPSKAKINFYDKNVAISYNRRICGLYIFLNLNIILVTVYFYDNLVYNLCLFNNYYSDHKENLFLFDCYKVQYNVCT